MKKQLFGNSEQLLLDTKGSVSHQNAIKNAYDEYDKFNKYQPIDSDFEKIIKKLKK